MGGAEEVKIERVILIILRNKFNNYLGRVYNFIYDSQYVKAHISTILSNWFESDISGQIDLSH